MSRGMSERVATLRYQQMVPRGLHEPFVANGLQPFTGAPTVRAVLKQQLGGLCVRLLVRLHEVRVGPRPWLAPDPVGGEGAPHQTNRSIG